MGIIETIYVDYILGVFQIPNFNFAINNRVQNNFGIKLDYEKPT